MGDAATRSAVSFTRLAPACGVELHDTDLTALDDRGLERLIALLDEFKVVLVRGAHLTSEDHLSVARRFGRLHLHPYLADLRSAFPHILVMEGDRALARTFHTDESYLETPPSICVLRMHTRSSSGGDTTWINLEAAYDALPAALKDRLVGAEAVHRTLDGDREVRHPVIRAHPRTGRPCLYVSRLYTTRVEGAGGDDELASTLIEHSEREAFSCRVVWSEGDVVIWDNRCTLHRVADDFDTYRRVERVAVMGERPGRYRR